MKVFDLHCDTLSELRYAERRGEAKSFAANDLHIDLEKLHKGDYMLQCFAAFVNLSDPTPGADPLVTALEEVDVFKRIMAKYSDKIAPVYRPEDIRKNAAAGKISGMLTIEEGGCCKGSLGVLRRMYELGARMMTLTWNHENELASPQRGARRGRGYLALPAQHRDRPEGARLRVFGGDGKAAYDRGREPPVRQGDLGHCRAQHPPLCGQPLQLPGIGTPLPQPDGRDDPGHGGARRSGGPELLQRLPR